MLEPLLEDPLYPTPAFAQGNVGWAYFQLQQYADANVIRWQSLNLILCWSEQSWTDLQGNGDIREAVSNLERLLKPVPCTQSLIITWE